MKNISNEQILSTITSDNTTLLAALEQQQASIASLSSALSRHDEALSALLKGQSTIAETLTSLNEAIGKLQPQQQQQQQQEKKPFWKKALIATGSVLGVGLVVGGSAYLGASFAQQSPETAAMVLGGETLP